MDQREVIDKKNTQWVCVQALSGGMTKERADQAAKMLESESEMVSVVCTPSGGAQTVRLQLPANWFKAISDEELTQKIEEAQLKQDK